MGKTKRNYSFRNKELDKPAILIEDSVKYSINKKHLWELDNPVVESIYCYHHEVKEPRLTNEREIYFHQGTVTGFSYEQEYSGSDEGNNVIIKPPEKDSYLATKQIRKHGPDPCRTCFRHEGKTWMLKGNGNKSSKKTKGQKKRRFDLKECYY